MLLEEVLARLQVREAGRYIDCTLGGGGHAAALLECLGPAGRLLALDRDPAVLRTAHARWASDRRCLPVQGCFSRLAELAAAHGMDTGVDGILLDLGISSLQLDDARRGFGFQRRGELDMRMNPEQGEHAADWLHRAGQNEIAGVLAEQGDERYARRIARAVTRARRTARIAYSDDLARLIEAAVPRRERRRHPATRTFLALRRHVNREAQELHAVLRAAPGLLAIGGRLLVISFHSLEDRVVKHRLRELAAGAATTAAPEPVPPATARFRVIDRLLRPGAAEIAANRRSRGALLRVLERFA